MQFLADYLQQNIKRGILKGVYRGFA